MKSIIQHLLFLFYFIYSVNCYCYPFEVQNRCRFAIHKNGDDFKCYKKNGQIHLQTSLTGKYYNSAMDDCMALIQTQDIYLCKYGSCVGKTKPPQNCNYCSGNEYNNEIWKKFG
ncbi:unnamed protein product [Cunninghamella blakesleeana]